MILSDKVALVALLCMIGLAEFTGRQRHFRNGTA